MAVTLDERDRLPCGVELEQLVVQITDGAPPVDPGHQAGCPYCQSSLRRLRASWAELRTIASEPVPIPGELTARIMARVRALAHDAGGALLLTSPRGETRIAHSVVARVIQRLALAVPGVVFASVRTGASGSAEPARLNVVIRLVITFGPAIDTVAQTIRTRIDRHVPRLTGGEISRVDITVEDVADDRG